MALEPNPANFTSSEQNVTNLVFISHTSEMSDCLSPSGSFSAVGAVKDAVNRCHLNYEEQDATFFAEPRPPRQMCERRVADCDVAVFVVGYARGSQVSGAGKKTFVEHEFDVAGNRKIPRIVLLWDPPFIPRRDVVKDGLQEQLAFRRKLRSTLTVSAFESFDEAGRLCEAALLAVVRDHKLEPIATPKRPMTAAAAAAGIKRQVSPEVFAAVRHGFYAAVESVTAGGSASTASPTVLVEDNATLDHPTT